MNNGRNADGTMRNQRGSGSSMNNRSVDGSMSSDSGSTGTRAQRADRN